MSNVQNFRDMPKLALEWHRAGRGAALATVVETWGSAPCPAGSQLVVSGDGQIEGSVSGGCVEGAVVLEAQDALKDSTPRVLSFDVADNDAFSAGLACGGKISVLVEPVVNEQGLGLSAALLADLVTQRAARVRVAYEVNLSTWDRALVGAEKHRERFENDDTGMQGDVFIAVHNPPLRVIIVGAVHIAQMLVPMIQAAGFEPIVIDPRSSFATPERFEHIQIFNDYPEDVLPAIGVDAHCAIVTLAHDPKIDDGAITEGLAKGAFYVGCLGSRKTHAARLKRLSEAGVSARDLAHIRGPVGLNIGAVGPAEIAVSIVAELVAIRRRASEKVNMSNLG